LEVLLQRQEVSEVEEVQQPPGVWQQALLLVLALQLVE
tara:strand:- start:44 stop:157 length:114 start_codon:yes stop_codon:yes gene_type:complete